MIHRALSLNTLSLEPASFDRQVEIVAGMGFGNIAPTIEDFSGHGPVRSARLIRDAGLSVATLTHRSFAFASEMEAASARDRLDRTIELAAAVDAHAITMTTGGRGALAWRDSIRRFAEAIAPCVARAKAAGMTLAIEPTSHLYADVSIAHRLADMIEIARQAGIAVTIDLFAC